MHLSTTAHVNVCGKFYALNDLIPPCVTIVNLRHYPMQTTTCNCSSAARPDEIIYCQQIELQLRIRCL